MTERFKPFLSVAVWRMPDGYAVIGYSCGPTIQRVGNLHPTEQVAREAARFVPRKRSAIGFKDFAKQLEGSSDD